MLKLCQNCICAYFFTTYQNALKIFEHGDLKLTIPSETNDPFEFSTQDKTIIDYPVGFLCFSKSYQSPLMWGHYADRHKGCCLEFKFPLTNELASLIHKQSPAFSDFEAKEERSNILDIEQIGFPLPMQTTIDLGKIPSDISKKWKEGKNSKDLENYGCTWEELRVDSPVILWDVVYSIEKAKNEDDTHISIKGKENKSLITFFPSLFLYKSKEWSYEQEMRMFFNIESGMVVRDGMIFVSGLNTYITSLILGINNLESPIKVQSIINHLQKTNIKKECSNIDVYKAQFHETKFLISAPGLD